MGFFMGLNGDTMGYITNQSYNGKVNPKIRSTQVPLNRIRLLRKERRGSRAAATASRSGAEGTDWIGQNRTSKI